MSYENQKLAGMVADMLKAHGWWQVEKELMQVENVTGLGNSTVYKVSVPRCDPNEVALYKRYLSPDLAADVISQERMTAAAHLLQSHNLAPHRLAEGGDWFIQAWEGDGSPMFENVDEFRSLGTFVAKLHQLPTDWYDEYRSKLCSAWPILEEIPRGSHAWFAAM